MSTEAEARSLAEERSRQETYTYPACQGKTEKGKPCPGKIRTITQHDAERCGDCLAAGR